MVKENDFEIRNKISKRVQPLQANNQVRQRNTLKQNKVGKNKFYINKNLDT